MNVSGSLASLLAKLVGKPQVKGETGVAQGAQKQEKAEGPKKGAPIADGVLAGVGYSEQDKSGVQKNVAEKENVARFLRDPELDQILRAKEFGDPEKAAAEQKPAEKQAEAKDKQDVQRQEARREEKADDMKAFAKEAQQQQEAREAQKADKEQHPNERKEEEEEGREQQRGQGWDDPEHQKEDEDGERGQYDPDAIGDGARCRSQLEDGTRCLRKPLHGTNYCREHAVDSHAIDPLPPT